MSCDRSLAKARKGPLTWSPPSQKKKVWIRPTPSTRCLPANAEELLGKVVAHHGVACAVRVEARHRGLVRVGRPAEEGQHVDHFEGVQFGRDLGDQLWEHAVDGTGLCGRRRRRRRRSDARARACSGGHSLRSATLLRRAFGGHLEEPPDRGGGGAGRRIME